MGPRVGLAVALCALGGGAGQTIHATCGQLCAQLRCPARQAAPLLTPAFRAQKTSRKNALQINGLDEYFSVVTGSRQRRARIGAAVEFSPRANTGPARD
jgi:hypothetical protein